MKELIKRLIHKDSFMYRFASAVYNYESSDCRWHPERRSVDDLLREYAQEKKCVKFIQIGSNDGITGDPIFEFVVKNSWTGILVEPVPYLFDRLQGNYEAYKAHLRFENSAIARTDGVAKFHRLAESKDPLVPKWYDQLGSFNRDVVFRHRDDIPGFDQLITEETVRTISFESLLKKYDFREVDLIHIDTEGYDYEIIKMINFDLIKPSVVLYEHKHLTRKDHKSSVQLLRNHGYTVFADSFDTIALTR